MPRRSRRAWRSPARSTSRFVLRRINNHVSGNDRRQPLRPIRDSAAPRADRGLQHALRCPLAEQFVNGKGPVPTIGFQRGEHDAQVSVVERFDYLYQFEIEEMTFVESHNLCSRFDQAQNLPRGGNRRGRERLPCVADDRIAPETRIDHMLDREHAARRVSFHAANKFRGLPAEHAAKNQRCDAAFCVVAHRCARKVLLPRGRSHMRIVTPTVSCRKGSVSG